MDDFDIELQHELFEGFDGRLSRLDVKQQQQIIDSRTDRIAQMLALYPTTNTRRLAKMFGMSYEHTVKIAREAGVKKVERRGGHNRQRIEFVNLDGYVVKIFNSISELAAYLGFKEWSVQYRLKKGKTQFLPGIIARVK